jgi:extracellular elastinolytic metalloproteinase
MVDRGSCTFVTKVRNIEKMGAKLAVIADNTDARSEDVIMSDDGTGHSINIPAFFIRKQDADTIKEYLDTEDTSSVYIKGEMEMVHPDNRVEYEFWYSTILDIEYWRLYDIALYQRAL